MTTRSLFRCGPGAVGLTLLAIGVLITIIAVQTVRLRRMGDRADHLQRSNIVLLCRADSKRKTYAYFGGESVYFDKSAEFSDRQHQIVVENDGTQLRVEFNGLTIACQTLQIDLETGQWVKDEPEFYERVGVDFDFAAASDAGAKSIQNFGPEEAP